MLARHRIELLQLELIGLGPRIFLGDVIKTRVGAAFFAAFLAGFADLAVLAIVDLAKFRVYRCLEDNARSTSVKARSGDPAGAGLCARWVLGRNACSAVA